MFARLSCGLAVDQNCERSFLEFGDKHAWTILSGFQRTVFI